jgi:spermidine synthase
MFIALCALALGAILTLTRRKGEPLRNRLIIAVLFVASGLYLFSKISPWDQKLLSAGVYFSPLTYMSPDQKQNVLNQALGDVRVVRYVEGVTSTVAVVDTPFGRVFRVDGKVEATSGFDDMRLQRMMGHLPMLLAERMERAINIGLGAGTTVGSLLAHPLKELQVIELEKNVMTTAREFSHLNHAALDDPRLQVVLNDGRNHLLLTDRKYEIITSDPFEPVVGGSASLYTYNHFMNARKCLAPGGIVCQYLPMYELSTHDFQMILRSFCRAFPEATLWFTGFDTILIGSERPLTLNFARLKERMALPGVKNSLEEIGMRSPLELLQTFVMIPSKIPSIKSGPMNTDQHPYIEFSAPRTHMVDTMQLHLKWLIDNYHPEELKINFDDSESKEIAQNAREVGRLAMEGRLQRYQGRYDEALQTLRKARELHPDNQVVLFEIATVVNLKASILLQNGKFDDAKLLLDEAPRIGKAALDTYSNLATWALRTGNPSQAMEFLHEALKQGPRVHHLNVKMAQAFKDLGRPKEALAWCDKAIALNPVRPSAKLVKADLLLDLGDKPGALTQYEQVLSENPYSIGGEHWLIIGILRSQTNQIANARKAFEIATQITPLDPRPWYNLARTAQTEGDYDDAKAALNKATELDADQVRIWLAKDPVFKSNQ